MKKLVFLFSALFLTVMAYSQDGLVYWSATEGWKFDFNADGVIDLELPTQTEGREISEVFVVDADMDGIFDLCEVDRTDALIKWHFYFNDGKNNFPTSQTVEFGVVSDKTLVGDFNADGVADIAIRRDNEFGLWWIIHFMGVEEDVNQQFGIEDDDILLAGDFNGDGVDDVIVYNKGRWQATFTPDNRPTLLSADIVNMQFGTSNDIPVVGDFDGDGYADMGLMSVSDGEISINLHSASKPENGGYSSNGRGSFDMTIDMPGGIKPTVARAIRKDQIPEGSVNSIENIIGSSIESTLAPNPVIRGGKTYFCSEALENGTIYNAEILSVSGQLVAGNAVVCSDNTLTISSSSLNQGTYLVRVYVEGKYIVKKLIIY